MSARVRGTLGVTLLTTGRGAMRVTPFGMLLAALAVVTKHERISPPPTETGRDLLKAD